MVKIDKIVLAQLTGDSAERLTKALEDGVMIKFNVGNGGSFVELVREFTRSS